MCPSHTQTERDDDNGGQQDQGSTPVHVCTSPTDPQDHENDERPKEVELLFDTQ